MTRKEIRQRARKSLRRHYWIFVITCLLAAVLGTEYENSLEMLRLPGTAKRVEGLVTNATTTAGLSMDQGEGTVWSDVFSGNWTESVDAVKHRMEVLRGEKTYVGDIELGHSRGVLASLVNQFASGALLMTILTAIDTIIGSPRAAVICLALVGLLLLGLFWVFVANVYHAIISRIFLEGRIYEQLPVERFIFLYRIRRWIRASLSMLLYSGLSYLWMLTVVIYPVKRYSYFLVPYIVAENPDIRPKEAIRLSRRMMNGHKWEACKLELTFLPWRLLSIATGGLTGLFFTNAYQEAAFAEYYADLRSKALEKELEGSFRLNDRFLFEAPDEASLKQAYRETVALIDRENKNVPEKRPGFWGFAERTFGLIPSFDEREKEYRVHIARQMMIKEYLGALEGKTYPTKLSPIPEKDKQFRTSVSDVSFMRHYSLPAMILLFFIFCMFGWGWEVTLHLLQEGTFVNRGVLQGPWLPIYGCGGILILLCLNKLRRHPLAEFAGIVILCGAVEYATSWALEMLHGGQKWWDYNGYFLNLNGRICAEGLLVFGIGGMAVVYVVAPILDNRLESIRQCVIRPLCAALLLLFLIDNFYSAKYPNTGDGITSVSYREIPGGWERSANEISGTTC